MYGRASWFDRDEVLIEGLPEKFVEDENWLSGGIPLAATWTGCRENYLCCRDSDLIVGHGRTLRGMRADFARKF